MHAVQVEVASDEADGKYIGRIEAEGELPTDIPYPPSMLRHLSLSPTAALGRATEEAWDMTALQGTLFWRMMLGQVSLKNLSGPLSIAEYAGRVGEPGSERVPGLPGADLAVARVPEPAADSDPRRRPDRLSAGRVAEGQPAVGARTGLGQQVGIALLILLMGVALFNDIARQFS